MLPKKQSLDELFEENYDKIILTSDCLKNEEQYLKLFCIE